jgi:hypothetical protein
MPLQHVRKERIRRLEGNTVRSRAQWLKRLVGIPDVDGRREEKTEEGGAYGSE